MHLRWVEVDGKVAGEKLEDVLGVLGHLEVGHHQRPDAEDQVEVARVGLTLHCLEINRKIPKYSIYRARQKGFSKVV